MRKNNKKESEINKRENLAPKISFLAKAPKIYVVIVYLPIWAWVAFRVGREKKFENCCLHII